MTDTIQGAKVLARARSQDARLPWVLLAELNDGDGCFARGYVVWYEDERKRRSQGYYTSRPDDARAELERRAGVPASGRSASHGARPLAVIAGARAHRQRRRSPPARPRD